ncbi:MAG: EAL domain-containing protein [Halopseudomonas sp.]
MSLLSSWAIYKAEALIRWQHPQRGLVSPLDFIHVAEETGSIVEIGDWVFREATRQLSQWRHRYSPDLGMSINTLPVQYHHSGDILAQWFAHIEQLDLPGQSIIVEITEGMLMGNHAEITDKLLAFRDVGIQVALDDFGTGYSSLSYLKKFDIDFIKIDQSFVRNLEADSSDLVLCQAIIIMAHKLGLKVVAEGVETEQQRQLFAAANCDYGQGYLFSKPVCAEEFAELLADSTGRAEPLPDSA